jgi:hypothetical protein
MNISEVDYYEAIEEASIEHKVCLFAPPPRGSVPSVS